MTPENEKRLADLLKKGKKALKKWDDGVDKALGGMDRLIDSAATTPRPSEKGVSEEDARPSTPRYQHYKI